MFNVHKVFCLFLFLIIFQVTSFSQETAPPPIEWGVINKADLEMTSFPKDTNATAVILCDYGESYFNSDFNAELMSHIRVKILNQNGFRFGTRSFVLFTKDHKERLYDVEGITYNLDANGNIVKTELDDDDIFEEKIDENTTKYSFTMPALKPGCIIDIKYKVENEYFEMKDWVFQQDEPVLWSEYRVWSPVNIVYVCVYRGYEPWVYNEVNEVVKIVRGETVSALQTSNPKCYEYRYAVKDAPAIRKEPYITTLNDYKNRVSFQLSEYKFPNQNRVDVSANWPSYVSTLLKHENFIKRIDDTKLVKNTAAEITKGLTADEDKLRAVYSWVSKSIDWDGDIGKFSGEDVDDIIKSKKGSAPDITFLLLSLLKTVGINGDPVILSTRSRGKIQEKFPINDEFNYIIARVVIGTKTYLIDATDPLRPMDVLPERVLGGKGLVVKEPYEWVALSSDKKNMDGTLVTLSLKEDGSLTGSIEEVYGEYKSLNLRHELVGKKAMELVKMLFESEAQELTIDSVTVTDKDSINSPLKVKGWFSSSSYAQKGGDMIYLNPFIVHRLNETPFKAEKRNFPVDFSYKKSHKMYINIELPQNYELKEPVVTKGASAESYASYIRQVVADSNKIQVSSKLEIKQPVIPPESYDQLKYFYSQMVSAQSLQLVIGPKKIIPPVVENAENTVKPVVNAEAAKNVKSGKKKTGKK